MVRPQHLERDSANGVQRSAVSLKSRVVVALYVTVTLIPFIWAATKSSFWEEKHSGAPVVTALLALLLLALIYRRRWAWVLLVLLQGLAIISFVVAPPRVAWLLIDLLSFALLLSSPMRTYVGIEFGKRRRDRRGGNHAGTAPDIRSE